MNGKEIKEKRIKLGLSANMLATKLGCSAQSVHNWENGSILVPKTKIAMLERILNAPDVVAEPQASYGNNQQGSLDKVVLEQSKQITTMQGQMDRLITIIERLTDETSNKG